MRPGGLVVFGVWFVVWSIVTPVSRGSSGTVSHVSDCRITNVH